jgi:hypothetical protein
MRKYRILATFLFLFAAMAGSAQKTDSLTFLQKTDFIGKVYSHFRSSLNSRETAFDITRAYLGFESKVAENYSIILKLDIGSPEDLSEYSRIKRYAYFKNAALKYKKNKLVLNFGIIDMIQFKVQEKFWDHRYIYKSYMDAYRFGSSADIGAQAIYKVNNWFTGDLTFSNGEGYSKLQLDNSFKTGFGITFLPVEKLTIRTYYSFISKKDTIQNTLSLFTGYTLFGVKVGGEFNYQFNANSKLDQDKWGYSFYSMYNFAKKWEVFIRYDWLTSNVTDNEENSWNQLRDGSALIVGCQFRPIRNVNISVNYRDWYPSAHNLTKASFLFLNLEYKL